MKMQIGNLAIICSRRLDITLHIESGIATVFAANGWSRMVAVDDNQAIDELIYKINHGELSKA